MYEATEMLKVLFAVCSWRPLCFIVDTDPSSLNSYGAHFVSVIYSSLHKTQNELPFKAEQKGFDISTHVS